MSDDFDNLARVASDALVSAIATDSWEAAKRRFVAVIGHERQIDATRAELAARSGPDLARAQLAQARGWVTRLRDALDDEPGMAPDLQALLADLHMTSPPPAAAPVVQKVRAGRRSQVINVSGTTVTGNSGETYVGVGKVVKRRFGIFLSPAMVFGRAAKRVATAHPLIAGTVTFAVAAGGISGGLVRTHAPGHSSVSAAPAGISSPGSSPGWPQLHGGPGRTGYQPDETQIGTANVGKLSQARTYHTNGSPSAPLIANGILYVDTNQLYAFDATGAVHCSAAPTTCTPLWTAPTADFDGMTIANGDVFVTDAEGVQAFDAAGSANCSGTPKICAPLWATSINSSTGPPFTPGPGSPVVANGVLYVPGYGAGMALRQGGAYVAAFDAAGSKDCSGSPVVCAPMWTTTGVPKFVGNTGSPAIANGVIYIANGSLYAFDAAGSENCSGTPKVCAPLWTGTISNGSTYSAPAVANGIVYVGAVNSGLYAFDATGSTNCSTGAAVRTCAPLWIATTSSGIEGTPAVAYGLVYAVSPDGVLSAFAAVRPGNCPGTGSAKTCARAPLWTTAADTGGYSVTSSPAVANGVVFSSTNRGIFGYDATGSLNCSVSGTAKTCAPLWSTGTGTGFSGADSLAIADGVLFINNHGNGEIYAYSP